MQFLSCKTLRPRRKGDRLYSFRVCFKSEWIAKKNSLGVITAYVAWSSWYGGSLELV